MPEVLIVTGASRGIGAATAKLAARRGYAVCVNYNASREHAEQVVAEIERAGGTALAVRANTAVEAEVVHMFETANRELGALSALVNNAGITGGARLIEDVDGAMLSELMQVNVVGYFLCAREAVRRMSTARGGKGGAIVNVSSRAAAIGGGGEWVHYAASKGAIDTMTKGLAVELGRTGIRVNSVRPGIIDTDIHAEGLPNRVEKFLPNIPFGRIGSAQEVAEAILWLLSPQASYVSGTMLDVSGAR
jgi:NAD(P)-dependent dehydrogenase (short-subunit alcohol dehydrogenase family)